MEHEKNNIDEAIHKFEREDVYKAYETFVEANRQRVNTQYRHQLHLMPPIGWMNDPNGFCRFKDQYHLFYQYYPYDTVWGPMYWGHAVSKDLLSWKELPIALAPGDAYDSFGIFSGNALVKDDALWVYYTGHSDSRREALYSADFKNKTCTEPKTDPKTEPKTDPTPHGDYLNEVQCLAISYDGLTFEKYADNPLIKGTQVGHNGRTEDFRDPKVWIHDGIYYMVVGSRTKEYEGQILFYISSDGLSWEYKNYFGLGKEYGTVWECPDFFTLEDKTFIIVSPQWKPQVPTVVCNDQLESLEKMENIYTTIVLIGTFDYVRCQFSLEKIHDLDQGFDFYAPQSVVDDKGDRVLVGWMNMWHRKYILHEQNHGWNGSMTLPRKLTLKDDRLYQYPIEALRHYHQDEVHGPIGLLSGSYDDQELSGNCIDLDLELSLEPNTRLTIELFSDDREKLVIILDRDNDQITLDRSHSQVINESLFKHHDHLRTIRTDLSGNIELRIVLDVSSFECFINGGKYAMTSLFFQENERNKVVLNSEGNTHLYRFRKWNLRSMHA